MSPDGYEADHGPVSAAHLAKSLARALKPVHAALRAPMPAQLCPQAEYSDSSMKECSGSPLLFKRALGQVANVRTGGGGGNCSLM